MSFCEGCALFDAETADTETFNYWPGIIEVWNEATATRAEFDGSTVDTETFENWPA